MSLTFHSYNFYHSFQPLQYREAVPDKAAKASDLGVYGTDSDRTNKLISLACALESGRFIARDIGGGDPEVRIYMLLSF